MKTLFKSVAIAFFGVTAFSFTTTDDKDPKIVIVDIVDHIETTNNQNITENFRQQLATLNQTDDVKVLEWKQISTGLDETKQKELLDSIQPEVVLTVSFKNSEANANEVTAVVSKNNQHFDYSIETAKNLTTSFDASVVKNGGVFQAESSYVQDNFTPAMFVSIETKNDQPSNNAIVNTLTQFIKTVESPAEEQNNEVTVQ